MMPISKALDEVKFRIPRPILETVFINRSLHWKQTPASVDEYIMNCVVRPRVLVDCNLVGGAEVFIPLEGISAEHPMDYISIYRIPKSLTGGRSIMSVLNISFTDPTRYTSQAAVAQLQNTAVLNAAAAVMDSHSPLPMNSSAEVQLIGENVVMVRDTMILPANVFLRCVLANDEQLAHLQLRSYRPFARLVELAVKSYIYNEYIIRMDQGEIFAGMNLGKFKDIVESYADAEELYQTFLTEKWQKIAFMNDGETWRRHLRTMMGGYR
jgi:hypothetical protein